MELALIFQQADECAAERDEQNKKFKIEMEMKTREKELEMEKNSGREKQGWRRE